MTTGFHSRFSLQPVDISQAEISSQSSSLAGKCNAQVVSSQLSSVRSPASDKFLAMLKIALIVTFDQQWFRISK